MLPAECVMLEGHLVRLRLKRLGDALKDYTWRRDPELAHLDATLPLAVSFSEYLMSYAEELCHPSPRRRRFAIEALDGRHIGNCMYYDFDEDGGEAEIGIMLGDRAYWDKGCGSEVIALLCGHIFDATRVERVHLRTLDWNIRARRCFEKCGFIPCGHLLSQGYNFILMELRRPQWGASDWGGG